MPDLPASKLGSPPYPFQPKLDVAATLRTTWHVFAEQPWRFIWLLLIPILVAIAAQLIASVATLTAQITAGKDSHVALFVALIFTTTVYVVQYGSQFTCQLAALWGAVRSTEGGRFTTGEALQAGFSRLLPYIGLAIVVLPIVLVGFVLLIVPGIIAGIYVSLASSACVIERRGPVDSVRRSFALVQGNWWRCLGALLLAVPVPFLVFGIVGVLIYLLCAALNVEALAWILVVPAIPLFFVIGAIGSIVPGVLFADLRALAGARGPEGVPLA